MTIRNETPGRDQETGGGSKNTSGVADYAESLSVARDLIKAGIPVFVGKPATNADGRWNPDGGHNGCGYWLPKRVADEPSLILVCSTTIGRATRSVWSAATRLDGVDTDPRNGGDESRAALEAEGAMPRVYGMADTPSGGTHELVATMGIRSRDKVRPGLDVKAGAPDGTGRGFLFIAPTRSVPSSTARSASTGGPSVPIWRPWRPTGPRTAAASRWPHWLTRNVNQDDQTA